MSFTSSRNCGFCGERGHTMFACAHPAVEYINTKFDAGLRASPENPFPVLDWLELQPVKTIKILAHKNNVSRSGKKWDIIESLLDLHYPEYQNALWKFPKEECMTLLNKLNKIVTSILHFQKGLIEIGILEEEQHDSNVLYTMSLPDVFAIYTDMYTNYSGQYVDIVTNYDRQFKIELLQTSCQPVEEECPICYDTLRPDNGVHLNCGHTFCGECVIQILTKNQKEKCAGSLPFCAMCRCRYKTFSIQTGEHKELKNKIAPFLYIPTIPIITEV